MDIYVVTNETLMIAGGSRDAWRVRPYNGTEEEARRMAEAYPNTIYFMADIDGSLLSEECEISEPEIVPSPKWREGEDTVRTYVRQALPSARRSKKVHLVTTCQVISFVHADDLTPFIPACSMTETINPSSVEDNSYTRELCDDCIDIWYTMAETIKPDYKWFVG